MVFDPIFPNIPKVETNVFLRRNEIIEIIKDHQVVTFDFISRRFRTVPRSTLHFDISQLIKKGYIKKLGTTRSVVYQVAER